MKPLDTWNFALFSAHIHHFLPHIAWDRHPILYRQWKRYHSHENRLFDDSNMDLSKAVDWLDLSPGILLLFHLGDHLFWPQKLAQKGVVFDLLMDRVVYEKNATKLRKLQDLCTVNGVKSSYFFSDEPMLIFKMRSSIKQGRHILIFADGTSSASAVDKRIDVQFLASSIAVKPGIAAISYVLKCPLYAMHSKVIGNRLLLDLPTIFCTDTLINRDIYIAQTMQKLFDGLAGELLLHPYRWECWGYLHSNGMWHLPEGKIEVGSQFDHLLKLPKKNGIAFFDRINYQLYY